MKFICPKPKTGVLCGACRKKSRCIFLHPEPPKAKLTTERLPFYPDREFNYLPSKINKKKYLLCLQVSEDFQLTKAETRDLVFYISNFDPNLTKGGGKYKSWDKIISISAIVLLERDNRLSVYRNNEEVYNRTHDLRFALPIHYKWIKNEILKITNETVPNVWQFFPETERNRFTGSFEKPPEFS